MTKALDYRKEFIDTIKGIIPAGQNRLFNCDENKIRIAAEIYSNNIISSRANALKMTYPATVNCLGEAYFNQKAREFAESEQGDGTNLNLYGAGFGAFLSAAPECAPYPFLRDLCDFEYACRRVSLAPECESPEPETVIKDIERYASLLFLGDCVTFLTSDYPVLDIAEYCLGRREDLPESKAVSKSYLIYRPAEAVKIQEVTPPEIALIQTLRDRGLARALTEAGENCEKNAFLVFLIRLKLLHYRETH